MFEGLEQETSRQDETLFIGAQEFTLTIDSRDSPVELIPVFILIPIFFPTAIGIKSSVARKDLQLNIDGFCLSVIIQQLKFNPMKSLSARFFPVLIGAVVVSVHTIAQPAPSYSAPTGTLSPRELQEKNKYFMCQPLSQPEPTAPEVTDCIYKIRTTWETSWLPVVRAKQKYLIARQNTGSILQWVGVSGGAAAATLGISNPKNSGTTAIVLGSAAVVTAITGIIWKQESSNSRIAQCTDVLSKQYKIQASLETWNLQVNNAEFRKNFLGKVKTDFIDYILPGLEGCMPGDWIYQS